jgi:hypothetical protein
MSILNAEQTQTAPDTTQAATAEAGAPQAGGAPAPTTWKETLAEEFKNHAAIKNFTDLNQLVKSYVSAQSMVGADKIPVPSKHATEDDWKQVFHKLGLPEKPEEYAVEVPKDTPIDQDFLKAFKEEAHKVGVLPQQAQKILQWYDQNVRAQVGAQAQAQEGKVQEVLDGLKKEWGAGFEKELGKARAAVRELGGESLQQHLTQTGLGNDPVLIRFMAKVGSMLGEDKILGAGEGKFGKTPQEAVKEINTIMGNPQHPYWNKDHPAHQESVAEMMALRGMASPGKSA